MKKKKLVIILVASVVAIALLVATTLVVLTHPIDMIQNSKNIISDNNVFNSDESETTQPTTSSLPLNERFAKANIGDSITFGEYEIDNEDGVYYTENKSTAPIEWGVVDKNDKAVLFASSASIE